MEILRRIRQPMGLLAASALIVLCAIFSFSPPLVKAIATAAIVLLLAHLLGLNTPEIDELEMINKEQVKINEERERERAKLLPAKESDGDKGVQAETEKFEGKSEVNLERKSEGIETSRQGRGGGGNELKDVADLEVTAGKYLDAQGVSPGAKAMAAAMKAKASHRAAKSASAAITLNATAELVVLYGSQTGNCMEIAKTINAEALQKGLPSKVFAMNDFSLESLAKAVAAIVVVSSTGDGDAPENCIRFVGQIGRKSLPQDLLADLSYTVCGLGDSNYTRFMAVSRLINRRFSDLGARHFYPPCEADEVDGIEEKVDAWVSGLWAPLAKTFATVQGKKKENRLPEEKKLEDVVELVGVPPLQPCRVKLVWASDTGPGEKVNGDILNRGVYSAANPFQALVTDAKYMTAKDSDRVVIHMEVDVSGENMELKAGDSLGVITQNSSEGVESILGRLNYGALQGDSMDVQVVGGDRNVRILPIEEGEGGGSGATVLGHIKTPCSIRHALTHFCDITGTAKKGLLRILAEYCSEEREKKELLFLSSRGGKEAYKQKISDRHIGALDLLSMFPSCHPDAAHLLDALAPLVPRFYSLSNSPKLTGEGEKVQVAFSVVKEDMGEGRVFKGVCTTWLDKILEISPSSRVRNVADGTLPLLRIPVFPKSGGDFKHPASLSDPVIMIGPGTGVAPFRGFLQERRERTRVGEGESVGESWLFFGCRRREEDFLYGDEFEKFVEEGTLSRFVVAFSRASAEKVYVQHEMRKHAKEIGPLLMNPKTHVFVCGDGAHMAKDVHAQMLTILAEVGDMKESMAISHLASMISEKRYVRDVWS